MPPDRYKETADTWNKLASAYQEKFMGLDLYNSTYDFICDAIVKEKAKILELGCGPGNITKYILSKRPDFDIYGIDNAPNMIELAEKNNPNARFAIMDSREIDQLTTTYDGIVCGFCLPYLSNTDRKKLIADCNQLLTENGLLYISFIEGDPDKSGYQIASSGDRSFFYFHELDQMIAELMDSSFGEFRTFKIEYKVSASKTDIHTIVVAKKITS